MNKILFTLLFISITSCIFAQDTSEELNQFKKEMQQKMQQFQTEMDQALLEMQSLMSDLQSGKGLENNTIIINGDTIIIAPNAKMPDNLKGLFQKIPEGMDGLQEVMPKLQENMNLEFFFGGELPTQMFELLDDFSELKPELKPQEVDPNSKEEKSTPKKEEPKKSTKKKKTYSI